MTPLRHLTRWTGLVLCATLGGSAAAQTTLATSTPAKTTEKAKLALVSLRTLRASRVKYAGQSVAVRGTVVGRIASGTSTTYLLKSDGVTEYLECDQRLDSMVNGQEVQVVVRVPEDRVSTARLKALSAGPVPSPAPAPPAATAKPLPSRGGPVEREPEGGESPKATATAEAGKVSLTAEQPKTTGNSALISSYATAIRQFNPKLSQAYADWIADLIIRFSTQHGLDPRLVMAIIATESNFRLTATSPKGAMGLGQLMPGTARGMGVTNAYDPEQNLAAAVRIIKGHLNNYRQHGDQQFAMALAAYNAGSGAVRKYGGVPPYRETVNYIWKVYRIYKALAPDMFK